MKYCAKHNEHFEKKCKACNREYQRKWFAANKEVQLERVIANKHKQKERLRAILIEHLSTHHCVDCGESDIVILDFDHVDPSTKVASISKIYGEGLPAETLIQEIGKCQVRCANCHRRKTSADRNDWRHAMSNPDSPTNATQQA